MTRSLLIAAMVLTLPAHVASAAIAVFSDGRTMKIAAYEVDDELIRLRLNGGGEMSLPIARLERIVDDEVGRSGRDRKSASSPSATQRATPSSATSRWAAPNTTGPATRTCSSRAAGGR